MSSPSTSVDAEPITAKRQLVEYLESGCKPSDQWRIGTEHEKFAFTLSDLQPVPYEGPRGIEALLRGLSKFECWEPVREGEHVIALKGKNHASVTLEPGGQIELSGAPLLDIHATCREVTEHLKQVRTVCEPLGMGMIGMGFDPKHARDEVQWMPKGRYKIMRDYMPTRGNLGLDMMIRTCTVQVNLDFQSEACMVKKFRTSLALQPIATALWANSPFTEGRPNGYLSYRSHIWTDTDPDRCGTLPFVFEDGMGFERYVDYVLDVPMYFVYRDGRYIDASGQSFRDFMDGTLDALPGERPVMQDWADHLTTVFPEVRLKKYLEMRGADGGPWRRLCALPALWAGILYDTTAIDAAWDLVKDWTAEEHATLRRDVPIYALQTPFRDGTVQDVAKRMLAIARQGLKNRALVNDHGRDETIFLEPLQSIADAGKTQAQELLDNYHGGWNGDVDNVYREYAY